MPSPFTASLLDGDKISVGSRTFEYIQAYNLMNKEAPNGGGGSSSLIFTINVVQSTSTPGSQITIDRVSGIQDFTSQELSISVEIDSIPTNHTITDSNTIQAIVPGNISIGTSKIVSVTITYEGVPEVATDNIDIISAISLTYVSNGDENGLISYYGTNRNTTNFSNPANTKLLVFQVSNIDTTRIASNVTDKIISESATDNTPGSWLCVSLNDGESLTPNTLVLRSRSAQLAQSPKNWVLQGTVEPVLSQLDVDRVFWDILLNITSSQFITTNEYKNYSITSNTKYRAFRILQTSRNISNESYLSLGEFEIYGSLSSHPTPPTDPSNPLLRVSVEKSVSYETNVLSPTVKGSGSFVIENNSSITNGGLQNGKTTARVQSSQNYNITPDLQLPIWTIILAARISGDSIIFGGSSPNNQFRLGGSGTALNKISIYTGQNEKVSPQTITTPLDSWGIWAVTFNGSQFAFFEWNNATLENRGTVTQTAFTFNIQQIGGILSTSNFYFGECEIYNSALNSTDLGNIALRLATTWGV